jgi:hypothetical protein
VGSCDYGSASSETLNSRDLNRYATNSFSRWIFSMDLVPSKFDSSPMMFACQLTY